MKTWVDEVFPYTKGSVIEYELDRLEYIPPDYRLKPPKVRLKYRDQVISLNKALAKKKPWVKGLYEAIIAVDMIYKDKVMEQKNRLCSIILDSTLEIAFKDFLLNHPKKRIRPDDLLSKIRGREAVQKKVEEYDEIPKWVWPVIRANYGLRCQFVHERSAARVTDDEVVAFREVVELCLSKFFGVKWPKTAIKA